MNVTQAMNTVFIQKAMVITGDFFRSASLQKHNNYKLKVLERCLNTQDLVSLVVDFAETEFSSAPKSKHDKFRDRINGLWAEFCKSEVQRTVFQSIQHLVHPRFDNITVVIGGETITAEQAKTFSLSKLIKLARKYNSEHPEDKLTHLNGTDEKTILRHIWRVSSHVSSQITPSIVQRPFIDSKEPQMTESAKPSETIAVDDGNSAVTLPNGDIYKGTMKNSIFDGRGTLWCKSGALYVGYFRRGLMEGQGRLQFPNGDVYVGGFVAGLFDGFGTYSFAGGTKWMGKFRKGHYLSPNGDKKDPTHGLYVK